MWMSDEKLADCLRIDPAIETEDIIGRIQEFSDRQLRDCRKEMFGAVLGLSGGLDSALVCTLLVKALGPENVFPCLMPGPSSKTVSFEYALELTDKLGIPRNNRYLSGIDDKAIKSTIFSREYLTELQKGNAMARIRMIRLRHHISFLESCDRNGLYRLAGTENASEHWTGFFTVSGDQSSDFEILSGYFKTQVWQIAKFMGIDSRIIDRDPSPELGDCATDEQALPAPYFQLDQVLFYLLELCGSAQVTKKIVNMSGTEDLVDLVRPHLRGSVDEEIVEKVIVWVKSRLGKIEIPYHLGEARLFQD